MVLGSRGNRQFLVGFCGLGLGLSLLCLGTYQAWGQIAPAVVGRQVGTTVGFTDTDYTATQGQTLNLVVKLSKSSQEAVSVDYTTSDGGSGTLTFLPGSVSQTLSLPSAIAPNRQSSVTMNVTLGSPSGAALGVSSTVKVHTLSPDAQTCQN